MGFDAGRFPQKSAKEISIELDDKEINSIRRQTISAYINNYHIFTFHGDSLNKKLEEIRKILNNFLALEIVEQTATKLVAKDFLNIQEFSLKNTVRRMDMLTRSIITDAKKGKNECPESQERPERNFDTQTLPGQQEGSAADDRPRKGGHQNNEGQCTPPQPGPDHGQEFDITAAHSLFTGEAFKKNGDEKKEPPACNHSDKGLMPGEKTRQSGPGIGNPMKNSRDQPD